MSFDVDEHRRILEKIVSPSPSNEEELLKELGLAGLPSRDQVHEQIQQKLLAPKDKLPAHWLPAYQMYVGSSSCYTVVSSDERGQSLGSQDRNTLLTTS